MQIPWYIIQYLNVQLRTTVLRYTTTVPRYSTFKTHRSSVKHLKQLFPVVKHDP